MNNNLLFNVYYDNTSLILKLEQTSIRNLKLRRTRKKRFYKQYTNLKE